MSEVIGFIGQAGTGKTTKIIGELETFISTVEWNKYNSLLALTFMHGSRRRLSTKFVPFAQKGINVDCQTIDSFCFRLVQRYKRYLSITKTINISDFVGQNETIESENEIICGIQPIRELAIKLLGFNSVKASIVNSYPVIVIDEFQDCDGLLLQFIKELSVTTKFFIAADDFQKLEKEDVVCEAVEWLRSTGAVSELQEIHRTTNNNILQSSKALRTNTNLTPGIEIIPVTNTALASWNIAKYIAWKNWGSTNTTLAIISPTRIDNDSFFKETIQRLAEPFTKHNFPGTNVYIEGDNEETTEQILDKLPEWRNIELIGLTNLTVWKEIKSGIIQQACARAVRLLNLRGGVSLPKSEFAEIISRQRHQHKVYGRGRFEPKKTALTVHQAKNREFDYVIILWSYMNQTGDLYSRKILYNAITRAKRDAIIIMQYNPRNAKKDSTIQLIKRNYDPPVMKKASAKASKKPNKK